MLDVMAAAVYLENITAVFPQLESCIKAVVNVTTDDWGNETTFLITREGRPKNIYYRGGPFRFAKPAIYSFPLELQDGCYDLILRDSFGDGIVTARPGKSVITLTYAGEEQVNDDNFSSSEKVYAFGNCDRRSLSMTNNVCGDGILDLMEECDDGNSNNNDACLNDCSSARCGDGYIHSNIEECDDGNNVDGDGCSISCKIEKTPEAHTCSHGDTLLQVKFEGDSRVHWDNSLYLFDDASPEENYIWYAEKSQFEPNREYVGYACLTLSACYRFFFIDELGDGLLAGGLMLTSDGEIQFQIRPGEVGTIAYPGTTERTGPNRLDHACRPQKQHWPILTISHSSNKHAKYSV